MNDCWPKIGSLAVYRRTDELFVIVTESFRRDCMGAVTGCVFVLVLKRTGEVVIDFEALDALKNNRIYKKIV